MTNTTTILNRPLAVDEVAEKLGVGPRYVRRMISERRVPFLKIGHLVRISPEAVGEVAPELVGIEVAVPRLMPAVW